jgi:prepilin-type N-terminal cleavage/methylation domain-containing protein
MRQGPTDFQKTGGFTIIETLIVLAIAGLILLIVFEAIPALERSSRNNQRRQDVASILAAVSHYELNDSGNFPSECATLLRPVHCSQSGGGPNPNDYFMQFAQSKLTYYADGNISSNPQTSTARFNRAAVTNVEMVQVWDYEKCGAGGTATIAGAGYSDMVALYALESGGGATTPQCEQL